MKAHQVWPPQMRDLTRPGNLPTAKDQWKVTITTNQQIFFINGTINPRTQGECAVQLDLHHPQNGLESIAVLKTRFNTTEHFHHVSVDATVVTDFSPGTYVLDWSPYPLGSFFIAGDDYWSIVMVEL